MFNMLIKLTAKTQSSVLINPSAVAKVETHATGVGSEITFILGMTLQVLETMEDIIKLLSPVITSPAPVTTPVSESKKGVSEKTTEESAAPSSSDAKKSK